MDLGFTYTFPALKGIQGNREYFVAMCPLKLIPRIFLFDEEEIPPEFRSQRVINKSRIPDITEYILLNSNDYVFSSLTASIDGETKFVSFNAEGIVPCIGTLIISMEARFLINDGQHRRAAIEEALKANPDLGNETISVVFYSDAGLKRSQQIFSDLNRHAVNTTRSIGILYDSRDKLAMLTKKVIEQVPLLKSLTDMENSSLSKFSPKVFTLSNIHSTDLRILGKAKGAGVGPKDTEFVIEFWTTLCQVIHEWNEVKNKTLTAYELRKNFVHSHGIVLEALGIIGNNLYASGSCSLAKAFEGLPKIDWRRSNHEDWLGRVISAEGRINKNTNCIHLTADRIKQLLNLPSTVD